MRRLVRVLCGGVIGLLGSLGDPLAARAALDAQVVTIGGEVRERYEFRDQADFNSNASDTLSFIGSRIRLHLNYDVTPDIIFFIQFQDARLFGSEATTFSNDNNVDLHQGYLMVKNLSAMNLTIGRQELMFGDSRLVGNFGWSNTGRSFDGLRVTYLAAPVRVDLWGTTVKQYGTTIANPNPSFTPATSNRDAQQFYGLYGSLKTALAVVEPYVLYFLDTGNATPSVIKAPLTTGQRRATLGLRVDGKVAKDSIDFTGEGAYQVGSMDARPLIGTTPASPESDIAAYAIAIKAGYTAPIGMKPRVGIEYDRASGDEDRTDDKFQTFENLFPTNHLHYGYMDYVGWRNMQDLRFSIGIKPVASAGVSLDYHRFSLAEKDDNWYAASGAVFKTTPPGNTESDLGQEIDLVAYTMVKEKLRVEAGYGRFLPGDYVDANFPAATEASNWVYLQVGTSF